MSGGLCMYSLPNRSGFTDGSGTQVVALDVVEYRFGRRRGILMEALQDGDAFVLFRDTQLVETVKWHHLCKVPEFKATDG
jgi:hypothetical protein